MLFIFFFLTKTTTIIQQQRRINKPYIVHTEETTKKGVGVGRRAKWSVLRFVVNQRHPCGGGGGRAKPEEVLIGSKKSGISFLQESAYRVSVDCALDVVGSIGGGACVCRKTERRRLESCASSRQQSATTIIVQFSVCLCVAGPRLRLWLSSCLCAMVMTTEKKQNKTHRTTLIERHTPPESDMWWR